MAALCWIYSDLDGGEIIFWNVAVFSTPLEPVGVLLALALNEAKHKLFCVVCFALCLAEAGYCQWLFRYHAAARGKNDERDG